MKAIGKLSQYDKIMAFLIDPQADDTGLTDHDKLVMERWQEAFTFMRNYASTSQAVAMLMKRYPGLSRAQAYRDCARCISLFGDIHQTSKEGYRHLATEITRDAIAIARVKNNEDAMIKGAEAIGRINGVNATDPDLPDFRSLEPHHYEVVLPGNLVQMLQQMAKSGKMDLTQVVHNMAGSAQEAEIIQEDDE